MSAPKSSRTVIGALAVSAAMMLPAGVCAPAAAQSVGAQPAEAFAFLGIEGELGVYALELDSPPITLKAFLHPSGGMFVTVRSRKKPSSSATVVLTVPPTAAAGSVTATAPGVGARTLAVDAKGSAFVGVFVNGALKAIMEVDKNGEIVKTIAV